VSLLPIDFIGCLQSRTAQPIGLGKVLLRSPGILHVVLIFVGFEMPVERGAVGKLCRCGASAGNLLVISLVNLGHETDERSDRDIVRVGKTRR
jgi:hypothetical protein